MRGRATNGAWRAAEQSTSKHGSVNSTPGIIRVILTKYCRGDQGEGERGRHRGTRLLHRDNDEGEPPRTTGGRGRGFFFLSLFVAFAGHVGGGVDSCRPVWRHCWRHGWRHDGWRRGPVSALTNAGRSSGGGCGQSSQSGQTPPHVLSAPSTICALPALRGPVAVAALSTGHHREARRQDMPL